MKEKMNSIMLIVNTVLNNRSKDKLSVIDENFNLRDDCGLDSLDLAELTVRIEAEYDVDIFEDGVVVTVGDILKKLN